jgi:DNA-binding response OmpR family regulator/HD-like signal output (HDOD) protein
MHRIIHNEKGARSMASREYRALIVDDEPALRMLTMRELSRNGFICDAARDGLQARGLAAAHPYDVVVTDLCMPEMNGHALAVELLSRDNRPAIVVLTGVTEPRLAKDLIARGVDDIMFKPVDHGILAAKVRALVDRRASRPTPQNPAGSAPSTGDAEGVGATAAAGSFDAQPVDPAELEAKLMHLANIVPISQAALDVMNMVSSNTCDTQELVAAIQLDASLATELLRIANSVFYNPTGQKLVELDEAVVRIGRKRTGEIALATNAMAALKAGMLHWMDTSLAWQRSVAAGLAVEHLIDQAGLSTMESGLFLCATMHPLGRFVLGTLYPDRYQAMLKPGQESRGALQDNEQRVFGRTHVDVMAQVLQIWNIPAVIFEPLKYLQNDSASIAALTEPLRTKVELAQLAVLLGQIAVGSWEPWDLVKFPAPTALPRLNMESIADLIGRLRADLHAIGEQTHLAATGPLRAANAVSPEPPVREVAYCKISAEPIDFLVEILPSMGIKVNYCDPADLLTGQRAVINCLGVSAERLSKLLRPGLNCLLVTDAADVSQHQRFGTTLSLPQSYGALRSACLQMARPCAPAASNRPVPPQKMPCSTVRLATR